MLEHSAAERAIAPHRHSTAAGMSSSAMAGQGVGQLAIAKGAAHAQLLQLLQMPSRRAQPAKAPAPRALRRARMAMEQHRAITERSQSNHRATTERPRSDHGVARNATAEQPGPPPRSRSVASAWSGSVPPPVSGAQSRRGALCHARVPKKSIDDPGWIPGPMNSMGMRSECSYSRNLLDGNMCCPRL